MANNDEYDLMIGSMSGLTWFGHEHLRPKNSEEEERYRRYRELTEAGWVETSATASSITLTSPDRQSTVEL